MPSRGEPVGSRPRRRIAFWGDSLTAGAGGDGVGIDRVVAQALDADTVNCGIGGQTSEQIAARFGGTPARLTVERNRIPAAGPVTVTALDVRLLSTAATPLARRLSGTLAGVRGELAKSDEDGYAFTRDQPGAVMACPPETLFAPDRGAAADADTHVLWLGRNNADRIERVRRDVASCVAVLRSQGVAFLVLGVLTGAGETRGSKAHADITSLNAGLAATYRSAFLDVRRHLIDHGLAVARLAATEHDFADLVGDTVPGSLRSDPVHLNGRGYSVVGERVAVELARRSSAS